MLKQFGASQIELSCGPKSARKADPWHHQPKRLGRDPWLIFLKREALAAHARYGAVATIGREAGRSVRAVPEAAHMCGSGPGPARSGAAPAAGWIFGSAKHSLTHSHPAWNEAGRHRLTLMDRLFLAVIVSALVLLVFSSALLVDRSQSPVMLIERPEKAQGGRP